YLEENPDMKPVLRQLAEKLHEIETSSESRFAILLCEGHSDRDDTEHNAVEKHRVEEERSRERVESAKSFLRDTFFSLFTGEEIAPLEFIDARKFVVISRFFGAGFLQVNKLEMTEGERKNNRRVEFTLFEFSVVD